MSNLAQEEADRFFNYKPTATSHPEDAHNHDSDLEADDEQQPRRGIKSKNNPEAEDQDTDEEDYNTSTTANTQSSYTVPTTAQYANTGPKGVIADAQHYHRAKHNGPRNTTSTRAPESKLRNESAGKITNGNTSDSDLDIDLEEEDSFMREWREKRLAEMQEQYTSDNHQTTPHNKRTWGTLEQVNANGYLDAIENTPKETNVVVFLFDPLNPDSLEVEDELKMLAYTWSKVRFVKMHHKIAEMQTIEIPALLVYRGGEVFATLSGVSVDGLEDILSRQGILVK